MEVVGVAPIEGKAQGLLQDSRLDPVFATPFGDMMLTGCYGLIRAYGELLPQAGEAIDRALAGGGGKSLW